MKEHSSWKKSDPQRRSGLWGRVNRSRRIPHFDTFEKVLLGGIFVLLIVLGGSYSYYVNNVQGQPNIVHTCNYGGTYPNCLTAKQVKTDPFSVLYNGTIINGSSGSIGPPRLANSYSNDGLHSPASSSSVVISTVANTEIVIAIATTNEGVMCGIYSPTTIWVSDSQGNTFTRIGCTKGSVQFTWTMGNDLWAGNTGSNTGADTITVDGGGSLNAPDFYYNVYTFLGVSGTANYAATQNSISESTTSGTVTLNENPLTVGSILFQMWHISHFTGAGSCPDTTDTGVTLQTKLNDRCIPATPLINVDSSGWFRTDTNPSTTQSIGWTASADTTYNSTDYVYNMFELKSAPTPCPGGYSCSNAEVDSNSNINLFATPSAPAVALSTSPIDTSTCSSKECLFYESWHNATAWTNLKPWAWFLRTNATLPTESTYDPLQDPSIALIIIAYPVNNIPGLINYYEYMAKSVGQSLLSASGFPSNPGISSCSQTSTLYGCLSEEQDQGGSAFYPMATVLNFTGSSNSDLNSGHSGQAGTSFLAGEDGTVNSINIFSGNPGVTPPLLPCADPDSAYGCGSYTLPFFNMQSSYYIGFYSASGQSSNIQFGTSYGAPLTSAFAHNANSVWYWIPTVTTSVQGTTDTGGFFGFLGRTFGGAVSTVVNLVGSAVGTAATWVQNTALGPIGSVLQGLIAWLITQIVTFLNWVGSGFGFPTLGTNFLLVLTQLATFITNVAANIVAWITNSFTYIFNIIVLVITIASAGFITVLITYIGGNILNLINLILTVISIFFSYSVPASYLLMVDYIWACVEVWRNGVPGFLAWIRLNIFIFTFAFKVLYGMVKFLWRIFAIIKSFIPTEGGTPTAEDAPVPSAAGVG